MFRSKYKIIKKSGIFDEKYYLRTYEDVRKVDIDPIKHYIKYGWKEGRNPSDSFNTNFYLEKNKDVREARINPLIHYILHGQKEGRNINKEKFEMILNQNLSLKKVLELYKYESDIYNKEDLCIDIIIPVYNGLNYLEDLFNSIFENTDVSYRLIIVNDASPDTRVSNYIKDKINGLDNCFYYENEINLGFTKTVNFASKKVNSKYFIILNTDVIVPKNWLSRLINPFFTKDNIASITPFSNSAVFFSYPVFGEDNKIPTGFTYQDIDNAFSYLNPAIDSKCEIHSGVGFCMAINTKCWNNIGTFDAETFGKGYGEENDWCMRALSNNWINVIVPNLFVFHNHGGSFCSEEKKELMQNNAKILYERWPKIMSGISAFAKQDPWQIYRAAATLKLCIKSKDVCLIVDLSQETGGAFAYRETKVKYYQEKNFLVLLLTHSVNKTDWILQVRYGGIEQKYFVEDINLIIDLFKEINISKIFINNLVFLPFEELNKLKNLFETLVKTINIELEYVFHDFLSVCPSFFLMNDKDIHCNLPDIETCKQCLISNPHKTINITDIIKWRDFWATFFKLPTKLICFSENTKRYIDRVYNDLKIDIEEHKPLVNYTNEYIYNKNNKDNLNIGFFGAFCTTKGSVQIIDLARFLLKENRKEVKIIVYGNIYEDIEGLPSNIIFKGKYAREELPDILNNENISVVFFSSIVPETFSYVAQELMLTEVPIVCFNVGAPAERIIRENYKYGRVIESYTSEDVMRNIDYLMKEIYE